MARRATKAKVEDFMVGLHMGLGRGSWNLLDLSWNETRKLDRAPT